MNMKNDGNENMPAGCNLGDLGAYYDDQLAPDARRQLEIHLQQCAACRQELAAIGRLSQQLTAWNAPIIRPAFVGQLHAAINVQDENSLRRVARVFLALAACLFVAMSLWVWQTPPATGAVQAPLAASWETWAADPQGTSTASSSNNSDVVVARWMVDDLSRGSGNE